MKITEVRVQYGRTVSTAPFESERIDVGLTATVGEDDTALRVVHDLGIQAKDVVEAQLRESEAQRQRPYRPADDPEGI